MNKSYHCLSAIKELMPLKGEGHSYWSDDSEILAMSAIDNFLWQNLGPGFGISTAPAPRPKTAK